MNPSNGYDSFLSQDFDLASLNGTMVDPFLHDMTTQTINTNYLPIIQNNAASLSQLTSKFTFTPPEYLTATVELYYGTAKEATIPLLFPNSLSESLSTNFVKEHPIGSTYPIVAFSNSGESNISLSFVALQDYLPTGYNTFEEYINAIRKLTRPKYSGSYILSPDVYVKLANIEFYGVCDSVNIEYSNLYGNDTFVRADVTCQFTITSR